MRLTEPNTWVGNVYNPVEGHIYTDVKVTLVSRQQIVLRGCKTWLLCGEKTWTRSHLPTIPAGTEMPIEVKATVLPGSTDKAEPTSMPKPKTPVVEAFREREPPSAPGFAFVSTRVSWEPLPLSGGNVSSMIAMTRPSVVATTATPSLTETTTAEEQWPWLQRRSVHLAASRTEAEGSQHLILRSQSRRLTQSRRRSGGPGYSAVRCTWPLVGLRPTDPQYLVLRSQSRSLTPSRRRSGGPGYSACSTGSRPKCLHPHPVL